MKLITYGKDHFDRFLFKKIENKPGWNKPHGGLWASLVKSNYGWKEWSIDNEFMTETLASHFIFEYDGNIIKIDNCEDLQKLSWNNLPDQTGRFSGNTFAEINFEKMLSEGVDAIYLTEEGQWATRFTRPGLYGWDFESVLIMNPNNITEVEALPSTVLKRALSF